MLPRNNSDTFDSLLPRSLEPETELEGVQAGRLSHAQCLAADPDYPSREIIEQIAATLARGC